MKKFKKGFTITELIVVIVIVGILAAVLIPNLTKWIEKARLSTDITNMTNINRVLAVEEVLEESPNDAIELESMLESKGLNLETKSKGNYYFYEKATGKVVLAKIDGDRLEIVHRYGVSADEDTRPQVVQELLAPEDFFDGYWFVTTKSNDGFAQAIVDVRNGNINSSNNQVNNKIFETIAAVSEDVKEAIDKLTAKTIFINSDGEMVKKAGVTDNSQIINCIVSREVKTLNISENTLTNNGLALYPNLVIIDLPSNVKEVENVETLKELAAGVTGGVSVKSSELKQYVADCDENDLSLGEKAVFIDVENRNDVICKINLIDEYGNSLGEKQWLRQNNQVTVNYSGNIKAGTIESNGNATLYTFDKFVLCENDTESDVESDIIESSNKSLTLKVVYDSKTDETSYLKMGNNAYSANTAALAMNELIISSGKFIVVGTDNEIKINCNIPAGIEIMIPHNSNNTKNTKENASALTGRINNSESGYYSKLVISGDVEVSGKLTVCGNIAATGGNTSSFINKSYGLLVVDGNMNLIGSVENYGMIVGDGFIDAHGANVTTLITLEDWHGGTTATACVTDGIFPFQNWTINNYRVSSKFDKSSSLSIWGDVYVSKSHKDVKITVIGDNGVFKLSNSDSTIATEYNPDHNSLDLYINGDVIDNSVNIQLQGSNFSAKSFPFPLSNMNIKIQSGVTTLSQLDYKLLPGSSIEIFENAELLINKGMAVYSKFRTSSSHTQKYPQDRSEAFIQIAGSLVIGNNAKFSGYLKTSSNVARIEIKNGAKLTTNYEEHVTDNEDSCSPAITSSTAIVRYTFVELYYEDGIYSRVLNNSEPTIDAEDYTQTAPYLNVSSGIFESVLMDIEIANIGIVPTYVLQLVN